jgi:cytochrome c oxidase subunit IV
LSGQAAIILLLVSMTLSFLDSVPSYLVLMAFALQGLAGFGAIVLAIVSLRDVTAKGGLGSAIWSICVGTFAALIPAIAIVASIILMPISR